MRHFSILFLLIATKIKQKIKMFFIQIVENIKENTAIQTGLVYLVCFQSVVDLCGQKNMIFCKRPSKFTL